MSASPLVLAALAAAEKSHAAVTAILTFKVVDRTDVGKDLTNMVEETAAEVHETVEKLEVFPVIAAVRVKAPSPLIRALIARPEVERANSGLTQAPFAFAARRQPAG